MNYRLKDIIPSGQQVISVSPKGTIKEAISKMLLNDFSQLPVVDADKKISGVITWKTIGISKNFGTKKDLVSDYMDKNVTVLREFDNLLDSVKHILEKEFVFIRNGDDAVTGIVTLFDIALQFNVLSEPFIELENIEASIRRLIDKNVDERDFLRFCKQMSPKRKIMSSSDLTFGEYMRIIEDPELWERFNVNLDREIFVEKLDQIRIIRNQVMHFKTREISSSDLKHLKDVSKFFRILEQVG